MVFVLCHFFVQTSCRQTSSLFTGGMLLVHSKLVLRAQPSAKQLISHILRLTPETTTLQLIGTPSMTVPPCIAGPVFEDEPLEGLTTEAAAYRLWFRLEKQGRWREMRDFLSWKLFNSETSCSFCQHIVTLGFDPWKIKGHNPSGFWNPHWNHEQISWKFPWNPFTTEVFC